MMCRQQGQSACDFELQAFGNDTFGNQFLSSEKTFIIETKIAVKQFIVS